MIKVEAINNARDLIVEKAGRGKIKLTVNFHEGSSQSEVVSKRKLLSSLKSHLTDFEYSKLRRVNILNNSSEVRLFFEPTASGNDLIIVNIRKLRNAIEKVK